MAPSTGTCWITSRQRDVSDVHRTRFARGTDCWSDHRLVSSTVTLNLNPPKRRHARASRKKLDVNKLQTTEVRTQLQCRLNKLLPAVLCQHVNQCPSIGLGQHQGQADEEVLGFGTGRRHQDWFDENDAVARRVLNTMHSTHLAWINDKGSTARKLAYNKAKQECTG